MGSAGLTWAFFHPGSFLCSLTSSSSSKSLQMRLSYYNLVFFPQKLAWWEWWINPRCTHWIRSLCSCFISGWQQTGHPDNWDPDDLTGDLWEIWSSFYYHPWPGHWRHVPRHVWNDSSSGDIQSPGKHISLLYHILFNASDVWSIKTAPS